MKKLLLLASAIFNIVFLLACNKKQITIEEPKIENCLKVRYLGVGCKLGFFETLDTAKFRGTYLESWDGTDKSFFLINNSLYVFVNYYPDTTLTSKLIVGNTYFVEYQVVKEEEKLKTNADRLCFPGAKDFEQLIITNILTSNCTIQQ